MLPTEDPELLELEELFVVALFASGGEASGVNGSRVGPWLW
ncbi:MAG TPA: hypothetical protein VIJ33_06580 [Solirubrobacteraceae bacterium]